MSEYSVLQSRFIPTNYFRFNELALSFNGGKDCLVLLILLLAGLHRKLVRSPTYLSDSSSRLQCVYVQCQSAFPAVDRFVEACNERYQLDTTTMKLDMKQALARYLDKTPHVKAVFVGIRRTDPFGADLTAFQQTDHGWPDFMRVHPVIDWHLVHVWDFLRYLNIPYCELYDEGYTSLGGTDNTEKNPCLKRGDGYLPAYELEDDLKERLGRT